MLLATGIEVDGRLSQQRRPSEYPTDTRASWDLSQLKSFELLITIFNEVLFEQWQDAVGASESIGKAVADDFSQLLPLIGTETFEELDQLVKEQRGKILSIWRKVWIS